MLAILNFNKKLHNYKKKLINYIRKIKKKTLKINLYFRVMRIFKIKYINYRVKKI